MTHDELERNILTEIRGMIDQIRQETGKSMEDLMQVQYNRGLLAATTAILRELESTFKQFNYENDKAEQVNSTDTKPPLAQ